MNENNLSLIKDGGFWFPGSYSTLSDLVDQQYNAILILSIIFTFAIVFITLFFTLRYKKSKNNKVALTQIVHNDKLEFLWTFIPFLIVMGIFYWGFKDYLKLTIAPDNALEIQVNAKTFDLLFQIV